MTYTMYGNNLTILLLIKMTKVTTIDDQFIYRSDDFGRAFWVDKYNDLQSAPLFVDNSIDFDNADYVSEWDDFSDVDMNLLFNIYRCELINKVQYANSLTTKETPKVTNKEEVMNTYDEQFYKEIVKDSEFSYGKFNENNYPLHLQQH